AGQISMTMLGQFSVTSNSATEGSCDEAGFIGKKGRNAAQRRNRVLDFTGRTRKTTVAIDTVV
ncbi:hypothetical protein, partial [Paracoccus jeotgali]|uniref:hypothetical protein n=1 Tax=Paracoccus jeotgali TaxID=2065379 RepID=UPI0028A6D1D5